MGLYVVLYLYTKYHIVNKKILLFFLNLLIKIVLDIKCYGGENKFLLKVKQSLSVLKIIDVGKEGSLTGSMYYN